VREPGLDTHDWESEWAGLEEELESSPAETLPALGDLAERMLRERDMPLGEESRDADVEELVGTFRAARDVSDRVDRGEDVDPGDVAFAIESYREIYAALMGDVKEA